MRAMLSCPELAQTPDKHNRWRPPIFGPAPAHSTMLSVCHVCWPVPKVPRMMLCSLRAPCDLARSREELSAPRARRGSRARTQLRRGSRASQGGPASTRTWFGVRVRVRVRERVRSGSGRALSFSTHPHWHSASCAPGVRIGVGQIVLAQRVVCLRCGRQMKQHLRSLG